MSLTINTNLSSLNAQRNLSKSQINLRTSMERLSSGLRINSAKDDAAGLAISDRMTAQIRGLNQAARNANDGISLAQTAEGAMQEGVNILQRIRELAVQSANDTNSAADRHSLQAEVNQLVDEFYRIKNSTKFNNINLLDGSFTNKAFQVGANAKETIEVAIDPIEIGRYMPPTDYRLEATNLNPSSGTGSSSGALLDIDPPDHLNTIGSQHITVTGYLNSTSIEINEGDSAKQIAEKVNLTSGLTGVSASAVTTVLFRDFSDDGIVGIELGSNGSTRTLSASILTSDLSNLAAEINNVSEIIGITATSSGGTLYLTQDQGEDIDILKYWYDYNWTSTFVVETPSEAITFLDDNDPGTDQPDATVISGSVNFISSYEYYVSSDADPVTGGSILNSNAGVDNYANYSDSGADPTFTKKIVDITTPKTAQEAIIIADDSIKKIDAQRADLGALQNRFESTTSNLQNISENLAAARSRILDADIAKETSEMTKQNILQQAGTAILSQANQQTELVLSLLKG